MTSTVFCVDFDETLINTDRLRADQLEAIRNHFGENMATAHLEAYEATREEFGVPRIPLVLQKMVELAPMSLDEHRQLAELFHTFPYQKYVYPGAEQTIIRLCDLGKVLIFSDGDAVFQPTKISSTSVSGLVDEVLIFSGKIDFFADISGYWPAERYVFIDDKQRVLDAAKKHFGDRATTVLVQQGRYFDASAAMTADLSAASIADVADLFTTR